MTTKSYLILHYFEIDNADSQAVYINTEGWRKRQTCLCVPFVGAEREGKNQEIPANGEKNLTQGGKQGLR